MSYSYHGGECCGISHVHDFPDRANARWLDDQIDLAISEVEDAAIDRAYFDGEKKRRGKFGHAIEVVLTDDQMIVWAETLKKKGFKLGLRWLNDNSGNYCNLLTWAPKRASKKRPYKW